MRVLGSCQARMLLAAGASPPAPAPQPRGLQGHAWVRGCMSHLPQQSSCASCVGLAPGVLDAVAAAGPAAAQGAFDV